MNWSSKLEEQFMEVFQNCVFSLPTASENASNNEKQNERRNHKQFIRQDVYMDRETESTRSQS